MQQNRIETLHHNGNPLEQKRRCSNIPGRLRQSPAQLAQELKIGASLLIGPWDSSAIGTNSPYDDSPAYLTILLDAANSAAAPASREEASK